jgi:hypothetical protein
MLGTISKAGSKIQEYTLPANDLAAWTDKAGKPVWNAWVEAQKTKGLANAQAVVDDTVNMAKSK